MSQVIVTKDELNDLRAKTRMQELNIDRESKFAKWRKHDVDKYAALVQPLKFAFLGVFSIWSLFLLVGSLVWIGFTCILKMLATLFKKPANH